LALAGTVNEYIRHGI